MFSGDRRQFLRQAGTASLACSANLMLGRFLSAQAKSSSTEQISRIFVDSRRTIYYPYNWALQYAHGSVLNLLVQSPTYEVAKMDPVPYVDAAGTLNPENGQTSLFILNRDLSKAREVEVVWEDNPGTRVVTSLVLTGNDLKAVNGFDAPQRVQPQPFDKPSTTGGRTRLELPPRSYSVIQWQT